MLANIDNYPIGRVLTEDDDLESQEHADIQYKETQAQPVVQQRPIVTREDFLTVLQVCTQLPKSIASEQIASAPLYDILADLYLPKLIRNKSSVRMLESIVQTASSNPALARSTKTVSLLVLSREHQQSRFSHAATEMYADALQAARQQVRNPNMDKVLLISVGHMLSLCELFFGGTLDDTSSRHHTRWVMSLVESCCRDPEFPIAHPLRASPMRLFATWEALIVRRLPTGLPLPTEDSRVHPPGSMATLSDLTIITAQLLEGSDHACRDSSFSNVAQVVGFLNELVCAERKLHICMKSYYESTAGAHYQYTATESQPRSGVTPLFPFSYGFADLESTKMHIGYWMCLLALTDARLEISKTYRHPLDIDSSEPIARLDKLVNEYADHICMSIPFMGRPSCGWSGRVIAIRPLRFLLQHFRKRGEWQKLCWCVQCATDLAI